MRIFDEDFLRYRRTYSHWHQFGSGRARKDPRCLGSASLKLGVDPLGKERPREAFR